MLTAWLLGRGFALKLRCVQTPSFETFNFYYNSL